MMTISQTGDFKKIFCQNGDRCHHGFLKLQSVSTVKRGSICIIVPQLVAIGQAIAEIWRFYDSTVRPMLSDHCLSCLSCLWRWCIVAKRLDGSNETWHAGRPRPWPHCVRWGSSSPCSKGAQPLPNFRPMSVGKWLDWSRCHVVGK